MNSQYQTPKSKIYKMSNKQIDDYLMKNLNIQIEKATEVKNDIL